MYKVHNVSEHCKDYKFAVIRDCNNEPAPNNGYWYYGAYDNLEIAYSVANDLGNGLVVETSNIEAV